MSFVFATSHLPAVKRLHEEEEEEEVRPMLRSGSVRAFSHLREPVRGDPAGAVSLRGTVKTGRQLQRAADADGDASHRPASSPPVPDDTRAWHSPAITREDLMPEGGGEDEEEYDPDPGFSPPRGAPGPKHDPDPGFAISAPPEWGKPTRDAGFERSKQDMRSGLRDADAATDADTAARENAAQGRAPLPYGRLFEKRPTPAKPEFNDLVYGGLSAGSRGSSTRPRRNFSNNTGGAIQHGAAIGREPQQGGNSPDQKPPPQQAPATGQPPGTAPAQKPGTPPARQAQGAGSTPAKGGKDPLTILSERFAAFPKVVESLQGLNKVPTGRVMIEKLASVADKINVGRALGEKSYMDQNGVFRVKPDISPDTLGHEFQHLGEKLFGTEDPFLKVSHPADATAYPETGHMDKEFRAMRIQNQLLQERAQMMKINPLLHQNYYFDDKTKYPIPGSLLPLPALPSRQ